MVKLPSLADLDEVVVLVDSQSLKWENNTSCSISGSIVLLDVDIEAHAEYS